MARVRELSSVRCIEADLNSISLEFSMVDLQRATCCFDDSRIIGKGHYGSVYRGTLPEGTDVAVKVLKKPNESGFSEEVRVLSKYRHPHVVQLLGFGRNGSERLLVYEFLGNGDLSQRLHLRRDLSWTDRLRILVEACRGFCYLLHSEPRVYHRDIKSGNILLDSRDTAKIADFGLACIAQATQRSYLKVDQSSGTIGYADPNYIKGHMVTEHTEVFSFGMLLLETLTCIPPATTDSQTGQTVYHFLALSRSADVNWVLRRLDGDWPNEVARRVADLALQCISEHSERRPSFYAVLTRLRQIADSGNAEFYHDLMGAEECQDVQDLIDRGFAVEEAENAFRLCNGGTIEDVAKWILQKRIFSLPT
jgi:serine/threonine protein kinase